jgi:hypothetical protein
MFSSLKNSEPRRTADSVCAVHGYRPPILKDLRAPSPPPYRDRGKLPRPLLPPVGSGVEGGRGRHRRRLHTDELRRYDNPDDPNTVLQIRHPEGH